MSPRREMNALRRVNVEEMVAHHGGALAVGVRQVNAMAAVVDLRNANAAGIAFENRRRVIAAFSEPGKSNDTAREVQCVFASSFCSAFQLPFWRSRPYPLVSVACRRNSV
jgi:hypothetical protein